MANSDIKDTVKQTVSDEVKRVKHLGVDAFQSRGYLYPLKGIFYFLAHRDLQKPLYARLVGMLTLSASVIAGMFTFTYLPQAAILSLVNGPLAAITTILLVLSESSTIVTLLSKNFYIQEALVDTFDATLLSKNMDNVVAEGREIRKGMRDSIAKLGKMFKSPIAKFSPQALIVYLMYLPLNLVPVVGTAIFIILQGKRAGPNYQARYFQLKKLSGSQKNNYVSQNRGAYTSFGIVATLLEMVPVASILFSFTNATGAALMAADMEKNRSTQQATVKEDMDMTDRKEL